MGKWLFIPIQLHRTIESVETFVSPLISYILYMIHCRCLDEMEYFFRFLAWVSMGKWLNVSIVPLERSMHSKSSETFPRLGER